MLCLTGHDDIGQNTTADRRAKELPKRNLLDTKYINKSGAQKSLQETIWDE